MAVPSKQARLVEVKRGFGGDNAYYQHGDHRIGVHVNWALLHPFETVVTRDGTIIARFDDPYYVNPVEALYRLGYEADCDVDFCSQI